LEDSKNDDDDDDETLANFIKNPKKKGRGFYLN
jgi:hypothetical protein